MQLPQETKALLDSFGKGVLIISENWELIYANQEASELLEKDLSSWVGKNFWQAFPLAQAADLQVRRKELEQTTKLVRFECCLPELNRCFLINVSPNPYGFTFYFRDCTHEKNLEAENSRVLAELADSMLKFKQLADAMPQIVWVIDAQAELEYLNEGWYSYTGLDSLTSSAAKLTEVIHPDDSGKLFAKWEKARARGKLFEAQARLKRGADGVYLWHLLRAHPVKDTSGKIIRWYGTSTDINAQKLQESKKDEFLGIASHELKTPLTSIKGYVQILEKQLGSQVDSRTKQYLDKANLYVNKLTALIGDLLDVSRIQAGKLVFNLQPTDLDKLVRETVASLKLLASGHQIEIRGALTEPSLVDQARIEQVLTNLLTNAIKYSPNADKIEVILTAEAETAKIAVRDYGIGIPPSETTKIFERFYRAHNTQNQASGLGIGLYISQEIIKRHGGEIGVESWPGKGSLFYFTLPLIVNDN